MKSIQYFALVFLLVFGGACRNAPPDVKLAASPGAGEKGVAPSTYNQEEGHGHDEGERAEEDHGEEGDEHEEEGVVRMEAKQAENSGIRIATVQAGRFSRQTILPGEVEINEEKTVHLSAPAEGRVVAIFASPGDVVRVGSRLAIVQNPELPEKKAELFKLLKDKVFAASELKRAKKLMANLETALAYLAKAPGMGQLEPVLDLEAGAKLEPVLHAYSDRTLARETFEREKGLLEKGISSRAEYQASEAVLRKVEASFAASRSEARFQARREVMEQENRMHAVETDIKALADELRAMRVEERMVRAMLAGKSPAGWDHLPLISPRRGKVMERHATVGEWVTLASPVFSLADTAEIWVRVRAPQNLLADLPPSKQVKIRQPGASLTAWGRVVRVLSSVSKGSRQAEVLVSASNASGHWKAGAFVEAVLESGARHVPVTVPSSAVVMIEGRPIVFVREGGEFRLTPVKTGQQNGEVTEITDGLNTGTAVAAGETFLLKAEIGKAEAEHEH